MAGGFRVQSVEIEGFKGFTSPKTIDFKSRHVFLLGRNGNGKSSIVEAVRWGLFGSAYRPNEVIKNQHYSGDCRVTVELIRDGELWILRRTLNLGAGSSSEPTLTDRHGTRHPIREVMPQLDSVDAGEGTHIIFAPQSAPLRRLPEDLDPFERTVFNYLDLTHPQALLSNLEDFLEDQTEAEHELDAELTDARKNINDQIAGEETRRGHILNAPPWGTGPTPSIAMSEQKARNFIEEVTGNSPSDILEGLSLSALVENAEESLVKRRTQDQVSLKEEAENLTRSYGRLEELRDLQTQIEKQEVTVQKAEYKLESVYDGLTPDELQQKLEDARFEATTEFIKGRIIQDAITLIGRNDSEEAPCPICDSHHDRRVLELALQSTASKSDEAPSSIVTALESQLQKSKELADLLETEKTQLQSLHTKAAAIMNLVGDEDKVRLTETDDINQLIENYSQKVSTVNARLNDQEAWFASKRAQLDRLNEEIRFHRIQTRLTNLQADRKELKRAIDSYNSLVAFGESVRKIKDAVSSQLSNQLAQNIPRVSDSLSKAFSALTQHPWYDRLLISRNTLPKLQLRVASSHDPAGREDPTGVLNGQAESALAVVPHFAFSQTDDTPTEVYLVMLDDPTRALDTEHINILLERLRELGRNVQLIVASQETERFQEMIPKVFDKDSYVIIEPTGWLPRSGPTLKIVYE